MEQDMNIAAVPEAEAPVQEAPSPEPPAKKPSVFQTTLAEKIFAWLILPVAYCYASMILDAPDESKLWLVIFTVGFLVIGEVLHWKEKRSPESFVWLGAVIVLLCIYAFGALPLAIWDENYAPGRSPWETGHLVLFLHLFAVYWLLSRGNRLAEGKTSGMFVWDGITGFCILPFKNIYRIVTGIISCFVPNPGGSRKKGAGLKILFSLLAVIVGFILLVIAVSTLKEADTGFADLMQKVADFLHFELDAELIFRLFITIHVAGYVFALLDGSFREKKEAFVNRGNLVKRFLNILHKVPDVVWVILIALFSVFYVVFFVLQGKYFFSAFAGTLPEGYTFSTYAREGFFELCRVVMINFALLWVAFRTGERKGPALKIAGTALVLETLLFDAIAFAKLFLYIREYAFTPLRLQSAWLITSLLVASIAILISILTGKKTARFWFFFSALSLVAVALL
ncbi:MAG: DUF4173 domain-containing protein [Lachnospiraceae bacterium]|nr:DUF4173 domain-containing protein [Lachnospiraceae bacterium]